MCWRIVWTFVLDFYKSFRFFFFSYHVLMFRGTKQSFVVDISRCPVFAPVSAILRVRAVFHKTFWVCHVNCNFKLDFTCRITVIFGTLKGGSLLINTLASNICFSYINMFQNGVDALSKIVDAFWSKSSKFYLVWIIRKCSNFASLWHKHLLRNNK